MMSVFVFLAMAGRVVGEATGDVVAGRLSERGSIVGKEAKSSRGMVFMVGFLSLSLRVSFCWRSFFPESLEGLGMVGGLRGALLPAVIAAKLVDLVMVVSFLRNNCVGFGIGWLGEL